MKSFIKLVLPVFLFSFSCYAQSTNGLAPNVFAWGDNSSGQCNVPSDLTNAIAVAAGSGFSLALRANGTVVEWGATNSGGIAQPALSNVVSIAVNGADRFAVMADGTCASWGPCIALPPAVAGLSNVAQILPTYGVGGNTGGAYVVTRQGTLIRVWGCDSMPVGSSCEPPLPVGSNFVALALTGSRNPIVLLALGNDGQVQWSRGCEDSFDQWSPLVPADLTNAIAICGGSNEDLVALRSDGTLAGGGTLWATPGPTQYFPITGFSNVVAIAGTPTYSVAAGSVAVKQDGTVQVVEGAIDIAADLPFAIAISLGTTHNLALVNPSVQVYPPIILTQPQGQTVPVNGSFSLYASAAGPGPLAYQWFLNGTNPIPGATSSLVRFTNAQPQQSGSYTLVVTNPIGSVTSAPALVNVAPVLNVKVVPAVFMTGGIGTTYRLDYINEFGPTNAWTALATVLITNQPQIYFDLSAIGQPTRFYRLVQLP